MHPLEPVDAPTGFQQFGERTAIPVGVRVGERDTVGIDVLAQQGDLHHALLHQGFDLGERHDLGGREFLRTTEEDLKSDATGPSASSLK